MLKGATLSDWNVIPSPQKPVERPEPSESASESSESESEDDSESERVEESRRLSEGALLRDRLDKLRQVHRAMDNNNSGYIEAAELMLLGQARRKLGQATGEWTAEANNALLKELDVTGDGHVETTEFVEYFNKALPQDSAEFNTVVGQFMQVAAYCATSATQDKVSELEAEAADSLLQLAELRTERDMYAARVLELEATQANQGRGHHDNNSVLLPGELPQPWVMGRGAETETERRRG